MVRVRQASILCSLSLCTILTFGCASQINLDNQMDMVAIPASWQSPNMDTVKSDLGWLQGNENMDLQRVVLKALENNPDLRISANRLKTALAQQEITSGNKSIDASISAGASRSGGFTDSSDDRNNFSLRGNLSWEADVWGRLASDDLSAEQSVFAAMNDLEYARLSLATRTAQRWFDVTEATLQKNLLDINIERLLQSQDLVARRYSRGLVDVLDVLRIDTDVATARANLANQRQTVSERMRDLEVLIGEYPSGRVSKDGKLPNLGSPVTTGLPSTILSMRPDVMASKNRVLSAGYDLEVAKKTLYPTLSISSSATGSGDNIGDIIDVDELVWNIAGNIIQPILDGGRRRQQVVINEVNLDTNLATYLKTVLNAFLEAENALTAEVILAERENYLFIAVERALASEEKALEQYGKGLIDILSLLDVQRRSISAQQTLLRVQHDRLINRSTLHLAIGGQNIEAYINELANNNSQETTS
jgi:outer membrane protein, multidrug efflux system